MRRWFLLLLVFLPALLPVDPSVHGRPDAFRKLHLARLAEDPGDAEALIAMADLHETRGRRRHARRYLRAFVNLIYRHPRRSEAITRLAALRPAVPFVVEQDCREDGGYLVWRNVIDGLRAVQVPAGPYRRRLEVNDATAVFTVDMHEYLIDLNETPNSVLQRFLWEGGFEAPSYWGRDGLAWIAKQSDDVPHWFALMGAGFESDHPMWGLTWYEARAIARWAGKRIPTEAESEKAARGGIHLDGRDGERPNPFPERRFPWGNAPAMGPDGAYRANLDCVVPRRGDDDDARSLSVDSLPEGASPYGCLHMAGNVTEWNEDRWIGDEERFALPRKSPFAAKTSREHDTARPVRGGYFKQDERDAEIDARDPRTFFSIEMCYLFKCGLRSAADAPPEDAEPDTGPLTDEPDPLDAERFHATTVAAEAAGDTAKAYRFARAALRLVRRGPFRPALLTMVHRLRPKDPWVRDGEEWRNVIDGKVAVKWKKLRADRFEVTEGDLLRFAAEGGYEIEDYWSGEGLVALRRGRFPGAGVNAARLGAGNLPAVTISPWEAQAYARWTRKRLPSVAEWNRLAGRGKRKYPWGGERPTFEDPRLACLDTVPRVAHSRVDNRVPVGSFPDGATPQGLMDLYGSVGEWVTGNAKDVEDWPTSWWLMGGGLNDFLSDFRKSPDTYFSPESVDWDCRQGFRCVGTAGGR